MYLIVKPSPGTHSRCVRVWDWRPPSKDGLTLPTSGSGVNPNPNPIGLTRHERCPVRLSDPTLKFPLIHDETRCRNPLRYLSKANLPIRFGCICVQDWRPPSKDARYPLVWVQWVLRYFPIRLNVPFSYQASARGKFALLSYLSDFRLRVSSF